jgi:hypothetical protein
MEYWSVGKKLERKFGLEEVLIITPLLQYSNLSPQRKTLMATLNGPQNRTLWLGILELCLCSSHRPRDSIQLEYRNEFHILTDPQFSGVVEQPNTSRTRFITL